VFCRKKRVFQKKIEGDLTTPKGKYGLGYIYYRADRVQKPLSKIKSIPIRKNMGWCDDPNSKFYNKLIKIKKKLKIKCEKLYRKDHKYNFFILIKYNYKNPTKFKGSAIFLHLTKNYLPTKGCVALCEKDFLILAKLITNKTRIKIG
tara:strand:- start:1657 stop:2097 length:441 start_codon:yes stop_codon:yes gene_type:complete